MRPDRPRGGTLVYLPVNVYCLAASISSVLMTSTLKAGDHLVSAERTRCVAGEVYLAIAQGIDAEEVDA